MKLYEVGDTVLFQETEYLVMKEVLENQNSYLVLAGGKDSFELIVCKQEKREQKIVLELVTEDSLKKKILFDDTSF